MNKYDTILEGLESGDLEFKFFDEVYYKQDNKWKRRRKTYAEQVAEYTAEATAAAQAKVDEANAKVAEAEAAKQAALDAASASQAAANTAIEGFVGDAPENLDSIAEIAGYITKATVVLKSASFNITGADANKVMFINTTNAVTVTLPTDSTIPTGTEIAFIRNNTGIVTFAVTGGASLSSAENKLSIKNQYGTAAVIKVNDFDWVLTGSLE